jgi:hypothetical protein
MGEWAERAIEEEIYGERCLDCDETPCVCIDDGDVEDDEECLACDSLFCPTCGLCPDCDGCDCDEGELDEEEDDDEDD